MYTHSKRSLCMPCVMLERPIRFLLQVRQGHQPSLDAHEVELGERLEESPSSLMMASGPASAACGMSDGADIPVIERRTNAVSGSDVLRNEWDFGQSLLSSSERTFR